MNRRSRRIAIFGTLAYGLAATAYHGLSDMWLFASAPESAQAIRAQAIADAIFVLVSTLLVYGILRLAAAVRARAYFEDKSSDRQPAGGAATVRDTSDRPHADSDPGAVEANRIPQRVTGGREVRPSALQQEPVEERTAHRASESRRGNRLAGIRVLAAEDNEINRLVLKEMLVGESAIVSMVSNGRLAVERIKGAGGRDFDVLITDIQMPEMDGYEAAGLVHKIAPDLPIIGLTAHAMPEERQRCVDAGMADHVTKPASLEILVASILRHHRGSKGSPPARAYTPEMPADGTGIVDWPGLEARFKGKHAFIDKLVSTALSSYAEYPARLREAADARDLEAVAFIAHGLKGTGWSLGANSLRELAARTDEAARRRDPDTPALARQLAGVVEEVLSALARRSEGVKH